MTTFTDLLASFKDEFTARYKSPFWGAAFLAFIACHWKIVLFLLLESPRATEAIAFIEANADTRSIVGALVVAVVYVILFPWLELGLAKATSFGKNKRNDFQFREREQEIVRRKIIALQEANTLEIELRNRENQSRLTDTELAKKYQSILSGENFNRWLQDTQKGVINPQISNSISNYLNVADTVEGKFITPDLQKKHDDFVNAISTVNSVISDSRGSGDSSKISDVGKFAQNALDAHKEYRQTVREHLGI